MFLILHDLPLKDIVWPAQVIRLTGVTLTTVRPMSDACRGSRKRDVDDLPLGTSIRRGLSLDW